MQKTTLFFVKKFLVLAIIVITFVVGTVFVSFHLRTEKLTEDILLQQGRALFSQIILLRGWISQHGGVFVKVKEGVDPNPFLTTLPHLKVNLEDKSGVQYTLRNPGLVVRGISELAEKSGQFTFHVSSLDPVNVETNTPDEFERKALEAFRAGEKTEAFAIEQTNNRESVYRYMAPLIFEDRCNKCHAFQNLTVGDIRGGISINIPMGLVNKKLQENRLFTITSSLLILSVLFAFLFVLSRKFMYELNSAESKLVQMATIDDLTKLSNRKVGLERLGEEVSKHERIQTPLSCLLADIDHFKLINDTHGHQAGDTVLAAVAETFQTNCRNYDIICRYGGEEFLVVLPSTNLGSALKVAEKIRTNISEMKVEHNGATIKTTISIGVAQLQTDDQEDMNTFIKRADEALYRAKDSGRNMTSG
jgi:diguanylate cyclase (GGDEF)-like protein